MNITPLPSVEYRVGEYYEGDSIDASGMLNLDRELAYTSLIAGIEGMSMPIGSEGLEKQMYDQALTDIIEKVVKPLYDKVE